MDTMVLSGGASMSTAWMPMCGQGWLAGAASFLCMWTFMMVVMMLPSLVPMLWRYRRSVGVAGESSRDAMTALVAAGYFLVWILLGAVVYPLNAVLMAMTMRYPVWARVTPVAAGLVVLGAGALQFTRWKAHHLACCRSRRSRPSLRCVRAVPAGPLAALRDGLRLGLHCSQSCAGLTAVLLVSGIMDVPAMIAVTTGITLERLAPAGEHIARVIGVIVAGAGMLLIARAGALA